MSKYAIYKIECLANGKVYIGQSKKWERRWKEHKASLRLGIHHSVRLQRAWDKYGESAFKHSIIEFCDECDVDSRETDWIRKYDATNKLKGFNIDSGGNANKTLSEETRKKLSEVHRKRYHLAAKYLNSPEALEKRRKSLSGKNNPMYGRKMSAEVREKMSKSRKGKFTAHLNPMYGKSISEEQKELYRKLYSGSGNPFYGRKHSDSAREKMREAATGRTHSPSARAKMSLKRQGKDNPAARAVVCLTTGKAFGTGKEAAEYYGVHPNGVRMCCRGERRYAGKLEDGRVLKWKYID